MGTIMSTDVQVKKHSKTPIAMGAGFIALDIVEGRASTFTSTGGSCGNVMAILAWLGWNAVPIGRIGEDEAGDQIVAEYEQLQIDTTYVIRDKLVATPIVVQRFTESANGERSHHFSLSCPTCGSWLPRFRPVTIGQATSILESNQTPNVFYFDRVAPSSLRLAKWAKEQGAIVLFEPSSLGNEQQFLQAVSLCHVLKYSHDRLGHIGSSSDLLSAPLIIETLGEKGLRMRWRNRWSTFPSVQTRAFEDASGSGDWCSAGFLHHIVASGTKNWNLMEKADIDRAIKFGQALASANCGFEGARGIMYNTNHESVNRILSAIAKKDQLLPQSINVRRAMDLPNFCCRLSDSSLSKSCKNFRTGKFNSLPKTPEQIADQKQLV